VAKSVRPKTETPRRRTTGARTKAKPDPASEPQASDARKDAAVAAPHPETPEPSDEDIRVRAYFRYLERGGSHGASHEDWTEAKKDLKSKDKRTG
jgi:hypothetical protein